MVIDQSKLKQWSKNTIDCYLKQVLLVGENIATSFYNQSDLSKVKDCELMIIGINPGCGIYYSQWRLKEYVKSNPDFLYKGNPCFEGKSDEVIVQELSNDWALWKKMHRMLNYSGKGELLEHLDRFILTNMIFFGTDKENQIPKGINKEKCAEQTRKLIDDIEPKVVILLGKQCRELFIRISKVKFDELVPNSVYHCIYNKSHVLAIKHTAYHYSNVEMEVVGKTIGYVLDHHEETINKETIYSSYIKEDIFHFEERQKMMQSKSNSKKSDDPIVKRAKELEQIINCEGANKGINNDGTLEYEYYCYSKTNGKFLEKNGVIRVGLRYDINNQQYVLSIKSLGNNPDALIHKIKVYCSKEDLFKFDKGKDTVSYEDAIFKVETIANFMDGLLAMIKTYRETDYPEK